MAGLKAATTAPTWLDINGGFWPQPLSSFAGRSYGALQTIVDHPLMIHFIHRNLAYIITALVLIWTLRAWKEQGSSLFRRLRSWPLILVLLQVILGIFTVLYSPKPDALLWLGVAHQAVAMLLLLALVAGKYVVRKF
jgi:cytochrome c oxidase assembly protein subunit 15